MSLFGLVVSLKFATFPEQLEYSDCGGSGATAYLMSSPVTMLVECQWYAHHTDFGSFTSGEIVRM
jgi:hypothetical protein